MSAWITEEREKSVMHTINLNYLKVSHEKFVLLKTHDKPNSDECNLLSFVYDVSTRCKSDVKTLFIYKDNIKSFLFCTGNDIHIYLFKKGKYYFTESLESLPKFTAATFNVYNFYGKNWKMGSNDIKNRKYKEQMSCIQNVNADILALQEAAFHGGYSTSYVKIGEFVSDLEKMGYNVFINHYDSKRLSNVLAIKKTMNPVLVFQPQNMRGTNIARIIDSRNNEVYIASVHLNVRPQFAKQELIKITSLLNGYNNVIMLGDFNNEKNKLQSFGMPSSFYSQPTLRMTGYKTKKTIDHIWFKGSVYPTYLPGEDDDGAHTFVGIKNCDSSDHLGVRQAFIF